MVTPVTPIPVERLIEWQKMGRKRTVGVQPSVRESRTSKIDGARTFIGSEILSRD